MAHDGVFHIAEFLAPAEGCSSHSRTVIPFCEPVAVLSGGRPALRSSDKRGVQGDLSGAITQLTQGHHYNEHPRYTPDGQILWMSNANGLSSMIGTDWWTMKADGSNPTRLSTFNDSGSPEYYGQRSLWATVVQTDDWSPDRTYFFGDLETSLLTANSVILRVSLTCP